MDKRVILTVVICFGILFAWQKLFAPPPKPPAPQAAATQTPTASPASPSAASAGSAAPTPAGAPVAGAAAEKAPEQQKPERTFDVVEQPGLYRAKFSSWGAAPVEFTLLDPQYQETIKEGGGKKTQPINLVRRAEPELPLTVTFPQSDFTLAPDAAWTRVKQNVNELVYAWENDVVRVEKHYRFSPTSYEVDLSLTVQNKSDKALNEHLDLAVFGWHDPNVKSGGMFSARVAQAEGLCHVEGKLQHANLDALMKEPLAGQGTVRWVGIDEKYFLIAAAIQPGGEKRSCSVGARPDGTIAAHLTTEPRAIAPRASTEYQFATFFGPKLLHQLDDVKVGGVDAKLGDALNYGWQLTEALARPMLAVLKAIHKVVPNWGLAIIVFTMLLKAVTWIPTQKSMKSMKAMAKLKPEMDKIKEKYGNDKQKQNEAVMKLYQQHGINPLGGCLPMLIQMPIYIAFYSMLGNSVELYRSAFVGPIRDLSAPDPYYVLPIITGALMFLQQKMSPSSNDPNQKAMMYTMPVFFMAINVVLPSGLTLYMLTNTVLSMLQQWMMNRQDAAPKLARS